MRFLIRKNARQDRVEKKWKRGSSQNDADNWTKNSSKRATKMWLFYLFDSYTID
jgi:hypothetical protein